MYPITHLKLRHLTLASNVALACMFLGTSVWAADQELLDILRSNGAITQAQYDELLAKESLSAADVEPIRVSLDRGGFNVRSSDGDFAIKIGARLHADVATHLNDSDTGYDATDGTELRRARIELSGTMHKDWRWAAEYDLADDAVAVKDFWLSYRGLDRVDLTFGHQKQPYSLDIEMSSNDIPFMDRSVDAYLLAPFVDRAIGVRADSSGEHWYFSGGLFGESVQGNILPDALVPQGGRGDEGWGYAARYVYAPIIESDRVLHLGFRAAYREPSDTVGLLRIRDETTHFSNLRIVDTGQLTGVDGTTLFGPEFAYADGRFSVYGEYNDASISRQTEPDLDFSSWHVNATWSLSGASRASAYRIDSGEFKRFTPASNFSRGNGGGAWELAASLASIDLNDGPFIGGSEKVFTAGANWYVNPNTRFLINWTHILDTDGSNTIRAGADGMNIISARAQYIF